MTEENTYWWRGIRKCRTCGRLRKREEYERGKGVDSTAA